MHLEIAWQSLGDGSSPEDSTRKGVYPTQNRQCNFNGLGAECLTFSTHRGG